MSASTIQRVFKPQVYGHTNHSDMVLAAKEKEHPVIFAVKNFFHSLFTFGLKKSLDELRSNRRGHEVAECLESILSNLPENYGSGDFYETGTVLRCSQKTLYTNNKYGYQIELEKNQICLYEIKNIDERSRINLETRTVLKTIPSEDEYNKFKSELSKIVNNHLYKFLHLSDKEDVSNYTRILEGLGVKEKDFDIFANIEVDASSTISQLTSLQSLINNENLENGNPKLPEGLTKIGKCLYFYFKDIDEQNARKGAIDIKALQHSNSQFEQAFREMIGINSLNFFDLIYAKQNSDQLSQKLVNPQSIIPDKVKYLNQHIAMNNHDLKIVQEFCTVGNKIGEDTRDFVFSSVLNGQQTFSSNAQKQDRDLFLDKKSKYAETTGINHNYEVVRVKPTFNGSVFNYPIDTIGSYQINDKYSVKDAKELLNKIILQKYPTFPNIGNITIYIPHIIILKKVPFDQDKKIFQTHIAVMQEAAQKLIAKNAGLNLVYVPIWFNSHPIVVEDAPEINQEFYTKIIPILKSFINEKEEPLLGELINLSEDMLNFTNFRLADKFLTILRILITKYSLNFLPLAGCMSAKDRTQSLVYGSNTLIMLYHKKGAKDFSFQDEEGLLRRLNENDMEFLSMLNNNVIGLTARSRMGIGRYNNKNLIIEVAKFINYPELQNKISTKPLVNTKS